MGVFIIKYQDTRPSIEMALKNPDGSAFDLTNADTVYLNISLYPDSVKHQVTMVVDNALLGEVSYAWVEADWNTLIVGPSVPLAKGAWEHRLEVEVVGPSPVRITFPNDQFDSMRIIGDIGQGA